LLIDYSPGIESWLLVIEDLVVSDYPYTPGPQYNNIHRKWDFQLISNFRDIFKQRRVSYSLRTNMIPAGRSKRARPK
jgi:hypothetical protein